MIGYKRNIEARLYLWLLTCPHSLCCPNANNSTYLFTKGVMFELIGTLSHTAFTEWKKMH